MSREIGMFEIGFVVRAGSEENDARMRSSRRGEVEEHFTLSLKKTAQALDIAITNLVRENSRNHSAVFPGVARPTRSLGAVRQNPPLPIRGASEIARMQMQIDLRGNMDAATGTEKTGIGIDY